MATPVLIDETNFSTLLVQSTQGRAGTPDGNIFFDTTNGVVELITAEELAQVDLGSGLEANPLTNALGITLRGLYNFENQERRVDESLRNFKRVIDGPSGYRFAGAFNFYNGNKLAADANSTTNSDDRFKIRGSGFIEYSDAGTNVDRIYHGVRSLVDILGTSQPYYALLTATDEATAQADTWSDFFRAGDIDEVVQVFGSTANGDSGAGNFDFTTRTLVTRVRTFGQIAGESTSVAAGIAEFSGFSGGYGVGESPENANQYNLADVFGGAAISPWTGMSLEKLASPQTETGFNQSDGDFTWVLNNTLGGTVQECAAYLDALALQDADIDAGSGTYNGRKGRVWYDRVAGKVVTRSIGGEGLFIEGLSTAEQQNVIFTDDAGDQKTYPFFVEVRITVGAAAVADSNAWYRVMYLDGAGSLDFDTSTAVVVDDASGADVNGSVSADAVSNVITFSYAYDTNTQAGLPAATDKDCVVLVEGDGGVAQALTEFTITRSAIVPVSCVPPTDNNA
jgi:hypothetical protein